MANEFTAELREFIESEIERGHFRDQEQLVAEAVLQMKERRDREAWLRDRLREGLDDSRSGRVAEWDLQAAIQRLRDRTSTQIGKS